MRAFQCITENEFPKITTTTLQSSASRAIAEHCLRVFVCLCEIIVCRSCSLVLVVVVLKANFFLVFVCDIYYYRLIGV